MKRYVVAAQTATLASALFAVIAMGIGVITHDPGTHPVTVAAVNPDANDPALEIEPIARMRGVTQPAAPASVPAQDSPQTLTTEPAPATADEVLVPVASTEATTAAPVQSVDPSTTAAAEPAPSVAAATAPTTTTRQPTTTTTAPEPAPAKIASFSHGAANGATVDYDGHDESYFGSYTTRGQSGPLHVEAHGNGRNGRIVITVLVRSADGSTLDVEHLDVAVTVEGPNGPTTLNFRVDDTPIGSETLTLTDGFTTDTAGLYSVTGRASYAISV